MTLVSLNLPPGMYRAGTRYQSKGRWYDGRFIRFFEGSIRPVGAWQSLLITTGGNPSGAVRTLLPWRNNAGQPRLAVGTNTKAYVFIESVLTDITLAGTTTGGVSGAFASGLYGGGNYGAGYYGVGDTTQSALTLGGTWQFDTFGELLVGVLSSDGRGMSWDGNVANDFAAFTASSGSAPTGNTGIVITNERFAFMLGAGGDSRKIQWPSQETLNDWAASATNTAGDFLLPGSGKIICGRRGRNITLIFTDQDLFGAQYVGGTLIYAFTQIGSGCGIIGPNAVAMIDGKAEWMGHNGFYQYDGFVRPIPCEVQDYVFANINRTQQFKCFAVPMPDFKEVWYFFPCTDPSVVSQFDEPEAYVIHNYAENHWTVGKELIRSAGAERGVFEYPFMAYPPQGSGTTSELFEHERGSQDATGCYVESGPVEIGDGDRIMNLTGLVPDQASQSGQVLDSLQATLYTQIYPTGEERTLGPYSLANPTSVRSTARQVRIRIQAPQAEFLAGGNRFINTSITGRSQWTDRPLDLSSGDFVLQMATTTSLALALTTSHTVLRSIDGALWEEIDSDLYEVLQDDHGAVLAPELLRCGNGTFLAFRGFVSSAMTYGIAVASSVDGEHWTLLPTIGVSSASGVRPVAADATYGGGYWAVVGQTGATGVTPFIWRSSNPTVSWTDKTGVGGVGLYVIVYGQGIWLISGNDPTFGPFLWTTPDFTTYTARVPAHGAGRAYYTGTYGNNLFVLGGMALGTAPILATSPTAITWTSRATGMAGDQAIRTSTYGNGVYLVAAPNYPGDFSSSTDGVTWSLQTITHTSDSVQCLAYLPSPPAQRWRIGVPRLDLKPGGRR